MSKSVETDTTEVGNDEVDQSTTSTTFMLNQDPKFSQEEKVLCPDKDALYEGIVRKLQYRTAGWRYFVHYLGWNARWDKWLDETEILEATEENIEAMKKQQRKRKRAAMENTEPPGTMSNGNNYLGYNGSPTTKKQGASTKNFAEYFELPFTLKTILADDRERVMRLGFEGGYDGFSPWFPARDVHTLPALVTIHSVFQQYVKLQRKAQIPDKTKMDGAESIAQTFVSSLSDLMESALPVLLLYPPERAQYLDVKRKMKNKPLVEIYGCEFLLRLLVRLPSLLKGKLFPKVGQQVASLIVVLQKNRMACFKPRYSAPLKEELNEWEVILMSQSKLHSNDNIE